MGPGGAYAPDPAADWHLLVGDTSVLPAIGASLARVRSGVPARVLVELDDDGDRQTFMTAADLQVEWVAPGGLVDALAALEWPEGDVQAFVHGEATSVREVRRHLVVDRGVPSEALSVSGYWKRRRTEDGWREDKAEWNRLVEADAAVANQGAALAPSISGMPLRRTLPVGAILAPAALVVIAAYIVSAGVMVHLPPLVHLLVVAAAGGLAGVAAIAMSVIAVRLNDGRAVLLGFAFSVMSVMLVFHALATPGVLIGENGLVQAAGALNLPLGGTILAASALPALRRPRSAAAVLRVQLATVAVLVARSGPRGSLFPALVPSVPRYESLAAQLVFAAAAPLLVVLAYRAARTFLLTRRTSDLLVAIGVVFLVGAEFGLLNSDMMDLVWWVAHAFEVAGLGLVGIPAALDLRHSTSSRPLTGDLRAADLVADEETFLGGRVHALLLRLAEKDRSTEGHTRRVATLAVQIGEHLQLPPARLRLLALGGLLHDMGKLAVPDAILNKPGKLTDEEFAVIKGHPVAGRELLNELGGFPELVLDLVESHHERLDGRGYPNKAAADKLDLEVRILTVADVYDALTADRVYREAWPLDRALALLDEDTGSAFDGACVAALKAVVAPAADDVAWRATLTAPPSRAPVRPPRAPQRPDSLHRDARASASRGSVYSRPWSRATGS